MAPSHTIRALLAAACMCATPCAANAGPKNARQNDFPPPAIHVENWSAPQPGWLYVLDPRPAKKDSLGAIWLVDPQRRSIIGHIVTGPNPDFALSLDGSHLYVASDGDQQRSDLADIDTATGSVLGTIAVDNRMVTTGAPPYSTMFLSPDGATLHVLVDMRDPSLADRYRLIGFETSSGNQLATISVGNCGYGRLIDFYAPGQFDYFCPTTNRLRHVLVGNGAYKLHETDVVLPWIRRLGVAQAFRLPGNQSLAIIRGDGAVVIMDGQTASFSPTKLPAGVQGVIPPAAWPTSPDHTRVYFGWSEEPNKRFYLDFDRSATDNPRVQTVSELRVYDTGSWEKIKSIRMKKRFWSATVTPDGKLLYASSPEYHSVLVVDTTQLRETEVIAVGGMPSLILVAP